MEVKVRPTGGGERGQRRADRAGAEAGGQTPGPVRHAPLEELQRAQEPGPRTPDRVSDTPIDPQALHPLLCSKGFTFPQICPKTGAATIS